MFNTLTLNTDPLQLIFGVFACLLGHMSVQTYSDRYTQADMQNSCLSRLVSAYLDRNIHTSMWSHDEPERIQSDDNRLLRLCLWGHLEETQEGRCYEQKEHFHLLCEIRVSNLIMVHGHTLHTLKERKCVLELPFCGWSRLSWRQAQWLMAIPLGTTYNNQWPVPCD